MKSPLRFRLSDMTAPSIVFLFLVLSGAYFLINKELANHPVTEIDHVTVVREVATERNDAWRYEFLDASGTRFYQDICKDYLKPEFDSGLVINRMIYLDLDDLGAGCWSLDPDKHAGYYKERTEDGKPVFVTVH